MQICSVSVIPFFFTNRKMGGLEYKNVQEGLGKEREG